MSVLDRAVLQNIGEEKLRPAAVSRFGQERLRAFGIEAPFVPHCYDGSVFKPFPQEERDELRQENGTTDQFVIGICAANNDTITVTGLTAVKGAFLISSTGVVGTMTFATNVITITNGGTLVWSGLAWGT